MPTPLTHPRGDAFEICVRFFMRILNLRIFHSPWRGGAAAAVREVTCAQIPPQQNQFRLMQPRAATLRKQFRGDEFLLPPYQYSFMLGAACKPVSCWVQLPAASRVGLAALSLLKDCMQPKDLTGVQFLGYINNYFNYDTHTHTHTLQLNLTGDIGWLGVKNSVKNQIVLMQLSLPLLTVSSSRLRQRCRKIMKIESTCRF